MQPTEDHPLLSFIVPLHNTGESLKPLLDAFRTAEIRESWELLLVDDGSADDTVPLAIALLKDFPAHVTLVELTRNFGEHAAVLEGYRRARGDFIVNLDDDLQNPVSEALKLLLHLRDTGADVVYSRYAAKNHHWLRNIGSGLANRCATLILGKPSSLYLSSFRAITRPLAERIVSYRGPYPHIDGLILRATNRITTLEVQHQARQHGNSGYTPAKLIRLTASLIFDFSVMPLRLATLLGTALCLLGALILAAVLIETLVMGPRQTGWGSLMGALSVFSGAQLLMLGIIGEYVGRAFLTVSGFPQSLTRSVTQHDPANA
jgi:glycosyltransferase involved in cell wall biosynthesis